MSLYLQGWETVWVG
jgi:hypothetical protein